MTDHYNPGSYNSSDNSGYIKPGDMAISRVVNRRSEYRMEMTEAVRMRTTDRFTEQMIFPKHTSKYILPMMNKEGGGVEAQTIEYFKAEHELSKWSSAVRATYEASITFDRDQQIMQTIRGCSYGLARCRDIEILSSLLGGAGINNTASAQWDSSSADIPGDLGGLLTSAFAQEDADITMQDIRGMLVYYPAKLIPVLNDPIKYISSTTANLATTKYQTETDGAWAETTYGFRMRPLKDLNYLGKVIAVIPSEETADHVMLQRPDYPEVAHIRDEEHQVEKWVNHRYFGTFVYPSSEDSSGKSYKIMTIDTVCDVTPYPAIATIS